jgi:WD40 repeat protein
LESGEEIRTLTGHSGGVYSVAISEDGKKVVSGNEDKTIKVWNLSSENE